MVHAECKSIIRNVMPYFANYTIAITLWFPKCYPLIPRDLRPVHRGSVDTSYNGFFEVCLFFKGIMFC